MENNYELRDVVKHAKLYPDTFKIPSYATRTALKPGDLVKLHFTQGRYTQRMWVKVTERTGVAPFPVKYKGILCNDPSFIDGLNCDDIVCFEPKHIASLAERNRPETKA